MRNLIIIFMFFSFQGLFGQSPVNLRMCIDSALVNHPRSLDIELLNQINEQKQDIYTSEWLPEINLKGQASYQSDVVQIDVEAPIPGLEFPVAPKDQYKVYLDVQQTIFDAGRIRLSKELEGLSLEASLLETELDIESVKSAVVDVFYNVLILQENINILEITLQQVQKNLQIIQASVDNGVALSSDKDLLKVEELDLIQQISNLQQRRTSSIDMLNLLTGLSLSPKDNFLMTDIVRESEGINRKELQLINQQKNVIAKSAEMVQTSRYPIAFAFGQFGYGNPGLNLLNDAFDTYYIVGLGLQWNIWDWKKTSMKKSNMLYQSKMLENKANEITDNIQRARINQQAIIDEHEGNISKYSEILKLRERISQTYEKQLGEGTIKAIDYLNVVNQEKIMRIKLNNEKILLQKAIADYNLITGNMIFN